MTSFVAYLVKSVLLTVFVRHVIVQVVKVWPERGTVQVLNPKGQDKMFTYDAAYDESADTQTMYDEMVSTHNTTLIG